MNTSVRIGKVLGIPLGINYSWFVIFFLVVISLAQQYGVMFSDWSILERWVVALATSLLFFASVLVHELSHSVVATRRGIPVKGITLFIFGGVSQIAKEASGPGAEFAIAIVGPLSSLVLAGLFWGLSFLLEPVSVHLAAIALTLAPVNAMLGVFNMVPGFPLDGGRVLRAAVWRMSGNYKFATKVAGIGGQVVGLAMIVGGVFIALRGDLVQGLWLVLIGWFLESAAVSSQRQFQLNEALRGYKARDLLQVGQDCPVVSHAMSVSELVDGYVLATGKRCFAVARYGVVQGIITLSAIKDIPRTEWSTRSVGDAMIPLSRLRTVSPNDDAYVVMGIMDESDVNQVPVVENGIMLGLIARDGIIRFIRTRSELGV